MGDISNKVVTIYDYGNNVSLAERLAREFGKVNYYRPWEDALPESLKKAVGDGLDGVTRILDFFDPKVIDGTDLFVFPDIYDGDIQEDLVDRGKRVWGSRSAEDYEYKRELFLKTLKELGLPYAPYVVKVGVDALEEYLLENEDKYVKTELRGDGETWHHKNYTLSKRKIEGLRYLHGPLPIRFTVCDSIPTAQELAYDGFFVTSQDGLPQFSDIGFLGYENKCLSHVLAAVNYDDFPEEAKEVNERFAPKLADRICRSAWGTEIKIADKNYFIDATPRQPEPPGSIIMEQVSNLGEFMFYGADGDNIPLEIEKVCGVQVMLYSASAGTNWLSVEIPESVKRWVKLYNYCWADGAYQVIPRQVSNPYAWSHEQVGAVVGIGDTVEEAIDEVKQHCEEIQGFDTEHQMESLMESLRRVKEGEKQGIPFPDDVPDPASIMEET